MGIADLTLPIQLKGERNMSNKILRKCLVGVLFIGVFGVATTNNVSASRNDCRNRTSIMVKNKIHKIEKLPEGVVKSDDIEVDEFGNEIVTTGDEYDYPIKKEANTDTVVLNQDLLNELLSFEGYAPYNIKVREDTTEDYDVQISIDLSNIIRGKKANEILDRYNRHVKARYLVDTEAGWENVLIPFKLAYKNPLDDTDSKIEPNIQIYENYLYGVYYKDSEYIPKVTTLYILKSREERIGYIATKLPISKTNKCTLNIEDLNKINGKKIEIKLGED